jgi:hypothetical protein
LKSWDRANYPSKVQLAFKPATKLNPDQGISRFFPEPRIIDDYHRGICGVWDKIAYTFYK